MEHEREGDIQPPAGSQEEQVRDTREYLEQVSAERETTVPSAQDQGATADADTLGDALPGAPD